MKRVAVLGGGPAGAFAAERIAAAGIETVVIDEKLAWEKPCGGGITYKAYRDYPFLIDNHTPKKLIRQTNLAASSGSVDLQLTKPLVIYSRYDLNRMLLDRAATAGAVLEKTRILGLERRGKEWIIETRAGSIGADFCLIATGARNPLRNVGTQWSSGDMMITVGYYVPAERDQIDIQFFPQFEGYIWSFPRQGHLSVGIGGKGLPAHELRARLERWMSARDLPVRGSTFFGHVLPSLGHTAWSRNRIAGEGWMAVGDAGGLVDPVTGEGLYYAIRSADLATKLVLADSHSPVEQPTVYRSLLYRDFTRDLELGAHFAKRLFLGHFLYGSVPARLIQLMRRSPTVSAVVQDLFAGTQNYLELRDRLFRSIRGTVRDVLRSVATPQAGFG
ncbi:MAG TPA: NAD(P)/FAD-dependent oxidoreductase [Bryobacteraceae bacterium]|nr:NAD(P)/FAD-dependent oxidoreductase [Bryobacteraceae bacterium]